MFHRVGCHAVEREMEEGKTRRYCLRPGISKGSGGLREPAWCLNTLLLTFIAAQCSSQTQFDVRSPVDWGFTDRPCGSILY